MSKLNYEPVFDNNIKHDQGNLPCEPLDNQQTIKEYLKNRLDLVKNQRDRHKKHSKAYQYWHGQFECIEEILCNLPSRYMLCG